MELSDNNMISSGVSEVNAQLVHALRRNVEILNELALRCGVDPQPVRDVNPQMSSGQDVYNLLGAEMAALRQEQLRVLLLDIRNRVIGQRVIYQGTINSCDVRPAEVLRPAIVESAGQIIVAHNHPSGDVTPSPEDVAITRDLHQAGKLMAIELLDHVVIGGTRFTSLKERGLGFPT